jgi:hypothetical protein
VNVEEAIRELKMEIPTARGEEEFGFPCIVLSEQTAKLALDILERITVREHYGILYGDETEIWYSGMGEAGLALTKRRRSHEHGDKIYRRDVYEITDQEKRFGEWEEI